MDKSVQEIYGNRLRMRVCGLCQDGDAFLLVNHRGLTPGSFWAPPGGGVEFGQPAVESLAREFSEETGLEVVVGKFLFGCEFVHPPLHAVELFFSVTRTGGALLTGRDPEMGNKKQLLAEVKFMSFRDIDALPDSDKHGLFRLAKQAGRIHELNGYLRI